MLLPKKHKLCLDGDATISFKVTFGHFLTLRIQLY